ncbi:increased dna methylation 1 [Nicotiana attenuata]|uniref:Increased dna methylation 1 n=1 Tax=Nicotiana attenuata TaxID=49451 RepID=A0A1J6KVZ1_NICAT|nr:increased dna methylation 1 [Nicotiana attenuata]
MFSLLTFQDCFDPIVDSVTGRDFIPSMVYGRNIRGQDFGGMYCAILTVNSTVVSAGILRIFGQDRAELPLVATRVGSQGKGYFQLLFSCIEKLLSFLGVRSFVLPAAVEAMSIWTEKFGFQELTPDQLVSYRRTCWQMISFKGTSMLEKSVSRCRIIQQREAENDVPDE